MIEFIALQRAETENSATLFKNSITEAVKNQEKSGEKQGKLICLYAFRNEMIELITKTG